MPTTQYSIMLPPDLAELVENKVKSGAYASVSDVIEDGVRALIERDAPFETWLREEVGPRYDRMMADPSRGVPAEKVVENIVSRHHGRRKRAR